MPDSTMERTLHRGVLKYAVQRAIFNSDGTVADVRRSVLVEVDIAGGAHAMTLFSAAEYDALPSLADTSAALPVGSIIEVWDGRYLFGSARSESGYWKFVTS
jgi:hypothetical protein